MPHDGEELGSPRGEVLAPSWARHDHRCLDAGVGQVHDGAVGWVAHHSIALAHAETPSIHHIEIEHGSIDDVGRAYDRAQANGVPISISLGRHMNDKAISFYVRNPSGFHLEIGCGGIDVDEDWLPHDFGTSDVWGHHHADVNPFASPAS